MENPMKARILARLADLGLKPSSQEIREKLEAAGLNKTYLYEFVSGKKRSINLKHLPIISGILGVDVGFLTGDQSEGQRGHLAVAGICEGGAWRAASDAPAVSLPILPDPRHPKADQAAYLVLGNHAESLGITDGSVVIVQTSVQPRNKEIVVAARQRPDGATETSIRRLDGENLIARPGTSIEDSAQKSLFSIIGVVTLAMKTF